MIIYTVSVINPIGKEVFQTSMVKSDMGEGYTMALNKALEYLGEVAKILPDDAEPIMEYVIEVSKIETSTVATGYFDGDKFVPLTSS
jgi:DNA-directed RNA polymerase subunit F